MDAYRFFTKISHDGVIQIPYNPALFNKEVEIIILKKVVSVERTQNKAKEFVKNWAGFLKDTNPDNEKYNYLIKKHK